jgi:uncharacterized protein YprB with RNaseH-like and TPR domain
MGSLERRLDDLKNAGNRFPSPTPPPSIARSLNDVVGGRQATCAGIPFWQLTVPFERICATPPRLSRAIECEIAREEFTSLAPDTTLVMDIETGGFSGTPVFLIGVVALDSHPLRVEQWLARDYPEEQAILHCLARWARQRPAWVTFNGKSFDVPFVLDRATVHGIDLPPPQIHVDLLHVARRRWRGELNDCRLETLERQILNRTRVGDVPSCDVPDLFHHFIRTGNAAPLRSVLEHNQIDLVSSTELLLRLARPKPHHRL